MATYIGKRPNGTTFQVEWEPENEFTAVAKSHSPGTKLCRFCMEKNPGEGIGILIDNICSNKCEESKEWFDKNLHRFKQVVQASAEPTETTEMKEYTGEARAEKYFKDTTSRTYVMFSELLKAGADGCLMSDLQNLLVDLTGATLKSIQQDLSAKSSKWRSLESNPNHDEWWLFTSVQPKRGRPSKDAEDPRLWVVFKGMPIPEGAWTSPDMTAPKWVKEMMND